MVDSLTKEQVREMRDVFNRHDTEGSGTITADDLEAVMRLLGQSVTNDELQRMVKEEGIAGKGELDFQAFLSIVAKKKASTDFEQEILETFRKFDKKGTGFIHTEDLKEMLMNIGEDLTDNEVEEMVQEADIDGDGRISSQDFLRMITSMSSK